MSDHTTPEPHVQVTRYEVYLFPPDDFTHSHYTISIELRDTNLWGVFQGPYCLGADGVWEYEPLPSNRDDAWLDAHRFDLDTALRLAKQAAPGVTVNGRSAAEVYRRNPPQHLGGNANAEDCPACHGTNPPYPFLCPGDDRPTAARAVLTHTTSKEQP